MAAIKWKIAPAAKPAALGESLPVALFDTGYLDPQDFLSDKAQYAELVKAIDTVKSFFDAIHEYSLVEYH